MSWSRSTTINILFRSWHSTWVCCAWWMHPPNRSPTSSWPPTSSARWGWSTSSKWVSATARPSTAIWPAGKVGFLLLICLRFYCTWLRLQAQGCQVVVKFVVCFVFLLIPFYFPLYFSTSEPASSETASTLQDALQHNTKLDDIANARQFHQSMMVGLIEVMCKCC